MQTKPDKTRQILTVTQLNAVDLIVTGRTDAEVGEAIGVTRQTVNGWRHHHPAFIAALNARRRELWGSASDRLRALLPKALDALETAVTADPPDWRAASKVIELTGLHRPFQGVSVLAPQFIGPITLEAVLDAEVLQRRVDPLQALLGDGPVTEGERQKVLEELSSQIED